MLYPDDNFRAATADLFGDDAAQSFGEGNNGSVLVSVSCGTTEGKGVVGSPLPSSAFESGKQKAESGNNTATQRLAAERRFKDLQQRQVDAQPDAPDFP